MFSFHCLHAHLVTGNVSPCRKLSLSSNCIDKITNLNGMSERWRARVPEDCCNSLSSSPHRGSEDTLTRSQPHKELNWPGKCEVELMSLQWTILNQRDSYA